MIVGKILLTILDTANNIKLLYIDSVIGGIWVTESIIIIGRC